MRGRPQDQHCVALSAFARAEDRRAALAAGDDEYLTKPALPADVLGALSRLLSAPRPRARVGGARAGA